METWLSYPQTILPHPRQLHILTTRGGLILNLLPNLEAIPTFPASSSSPSPTVAMRTVSRVMEVKGASPCNNNNKLLFSMEVLPVRPLQATTHA